MIWQRAKHMLRQIHTQTLDNLKIITNKQHDISIQQISEPALKVLKRLNKTGYEAYLVGGCVRDLLLGKQPKDFDVVTNATPVQIKALFGRCFLIGRRFRLAHVYIGRHVIEVATFRRTLLQTHADQRQTKQGMLVRDNAFGTLEDDVWRRDFSINALYYRLIDGAILDFTNGWQDLQSKTLRIIGDSYQRFREDPVRILRAIRFSAKLNLQLDKDLRPLIEQHGGLLRQVSTARLADELNKLFTCGHSFSAYQMLKKYGVFAILFPKTAKEINQQPKFARLVELTLQNTDQRVDQGKPVSFMFLLAVFLWQPLCTSMKGEKNLDLLIDHEIYHQVLNEQRQYFDITRRLAEGVKHIWELQFLFFHHQHSDQALNLLNYSRFRAAYDMLLLRTQSGEPLTHLTRRWTMLVNAKQKQPDDSYYKKRDNSHHPR